MRLKRHRALLADMHDPTMDLSYRIKVADQLVRSGLGDIGSVPDPFLLPTRYDWQIAKAQRHQMPKDKWYRHWCKKLLVPIGVYHRIQRHAYNRW